MGGYLYIVQDGQVVKEPYILKVRATPRRIWYGAPAGNVLTVKMRMFELAIPS